MVRSGTYYDHIVLFSFASSLPIYSITHQPLPRIENEPRAASLAFLPLLETSLLNVFFQFGVLLKMHYVRMLVQIQTSLSVQIHNAIIVLALFGFLSYICHHSEHSSLILLKLNCTCTYDCICVECHLYYVYTYIRNVMYIP